MRYKLLQNRIEYDMPDHWSQVPTKRYIHTQYGTYSFEDISAVLQRILSNDPEEFDVRILWAVLQNAFSGRR